MVMHLCVELFTGCWFFQRPLAPRKPFRAWRTLRIERDYRALCEAMDIGTPIAYNHSDRPPVPRANQVRGEQNGQEKVEEGEEADSNKGYDCSEIPLRRSFGMKSALRNGARSDRPNWRRDNI